MRESLGKGEERDIIGESQEIDRQIPTHHMSKRVKVKAHWKDCFWEEQHVPVIPAFGGLGQEVCESLSSKRARDEAISKQR